MFRELEKDNYNDNGQKEILKRLFVQSNYGLKDKISQYII